MRLIYTDTALNDKAVINTFGLDLAYGDEENSFKLTVAPEVKIDAGALIYVPGTEWGGRVEEPGGKSEDGVKWRVYKGRTWHGLLERILYPDPGDDYVTVSGDAHDIVAWLIARVGLSDFFEVDPNPSGITFTNYRFDHVGYVYSGLRKMLRTKHAKLRMRRDGEGKTVVSVLRADETIDDGNASRYGYELQLLHAVNHMMGLGKGDLHERDRVDYYADWRGNVSRTQSIFGVDVRDEIYDSPNADHEQLKEGTEKKLRDYQKLAEAKLHLPADGSYDVDDRVGVADAELGMSAEATISKVIIKVADSAVALTDYETSDVEITIL